MDRHSQCRQFIENNVVRIDGCWFRFGDIPHDADDFSRCYDLVTFAEVSPAYDLPRICEIFPWYKPIIDSWETLVELYEKQDYKGVYHLLSSKHAEVMRLQGYEKKQSGIWIKKQ